MAHPQTEAQQQTTTGSQNLADPQIQGPVTEALTLDEAALRLENIFENDPVEQGIKQREYNDQKSLADDLKELKLDHNGDLPLYNEDDVSSNERDFDDRRDDELSLADDQDEEDDEGIGTDEISTIQAPVSWSKEQKQVFAALPPDAQNIIVDRERDRDKGFQVKTTELAEQRKSLNMLEQDVIRQRQMYADELSHSLSPHMVIPNVEMLNQQSPSFNPDKYHADKNIYDQLAAQQHNMQQQVARYEHLYELRDKEARVEYIKLHDATLREHVPEWADDNSRNKLIQFGVEHGYSPEDVQTATPEEVTLLNKAMKYDVLMSNKPNVRDQMKSAPKVLKPGTKRRGTSSKHALAQAKQKLARTGSTEDAAAVLAYIMKD